MSNLQSLANTNPEDVSREDICSIFNCKACDLNSVLKSAFEDCDDIETLKAIAVMHDGYEYQHSLEDILTEKMGEEAYDEFADENDL
ncbi:hypothetical protein OAA60_05510 [Porticoccaceae bacterium]|nr:hypothetical protein [Porticoccaceae bacterium]